MTEEEKKMLKIFKKEVEKEQSEYEQVNEYTKFFYNNHKEILNLIKKQQAEIEKARNTKSLYYENKELRKELEKKDKIIDLMADKLVEAHEWFYSEFDNYTKEDFKQYFEK